MYVHKPATRDETSGLLYPPLLIFVLSAVVEG
jgi:hypothetical protein